MQTGLSSEIVGKRYVVQDQLGAGAMGTVHRAWDRLTSRQVALKLVQVPVEQLEYASRSDEIDLHLTLAQEFKILASLRHPNIISVLDYGFEDHGSPYVAMELLEAAQPITHAAQDKTQQEKTDLLIQLLQALIYLHRRGILHRDIKPRNVLVITPNGVSNPSVIRSPQVKVLDFGLSVLREQATSGEVAGTPSYMAPEIWSGKPASKSSDLFAFGVMAFEIYSGTRPFDGNTLQELYRSIRQKQPNLDLLEVPDVIKYIVGRLLSKNPADRYEDASEVLALLRRVANGRSGEETAEMRESFLQAATFVGREAELEHLGGELARALVGQGSGWLLGGESGVGKSRLLDELRTLALVDGATVLRGYANREGNAPYEIWSDALRWLSLTTELSDVEAGVLKPLVPDIDKLLGREVVAAPALAAQAEQTRLLAVIEQVFKRQRAPLVVILEDLHWAGSESLAVLAHLSRMVGSLPLLLIGSYRDDESPDLPALLPRMRVMKLNRLSSVGIAKLVESMLGPTGRQESLLRLLQKETEGNVFFLVEVVRALAEEAGQLEKIGQAALPKKVLTGGVEGIIRRRLNRVPVEARPLIQIAAIAGRQLDLTVIAEVFHSMGRTINLDAVLNQCADAAVLTVQDGNWQFAHNKLRDGVLADLPPHFARDLHRRVALAIESVYQYSSRQTAAALAYHWREAGDLIKEEHYAALAGEQALRNCAYPAAQMFLRRALDLQGEVGKPKRQQATLTAQLGDVYLGMGQHAEARALYEHSLALAREAKYGWGVASSLNSLGMVEAEQGDIDGAAEYYLQALQAANDVRAATVMLSVLVHMASLLHKAGRYPIALEYVALALNHPAIDSQTHYQGERLLNDLQAAMPASAVEAAMEAGKDRSLREVVTTILQGL